MLIERELISHSCEYTCLSCEPSIGEAIDNYASNCLKVLACGVGILSRDLEMEVRNVGCPVRRSLI